MQRGWGFNTVILILAIDLVATTAYLVYTNAPQILSLRAARNSQKQSQVEFIPPQIFKNKTFSLITKIQDFKNADPARQAKLLSQLDKAARERKQLVRWYLERTPSQVFNNLLGTAIRHEYPTELTATHLVEEESVIKGKLHKIPAPKTLRESEYSYYFLETIHPYNGFSQFTVIVPDAPAAIDKYQDVSLIGVVFDNYVLVSYPDNITPLTRSKSAGESALAQVLGTSATGPPLKTAPIPRRVYRVVYNPILSTGETLYQHMHWNSPDDLEKDLIAGLSEASNHRVQYTVTNRSELAEWPVKADGFQYTEQTYLDVMKNNSLHHNPDLFNYQSMITNLQLCELLNTNQIDEVWLVTFRAYVRAASRNRSRPQPFANQPYRVVAA